MTTHWIRCNAHLPLWMCLFVPTACHRGTGDGADREPDSTSSSQPDSSDSSLDEGPGDVPTEPTEPGVGSTSDGPSTSEGEPATGSSTSAEATGGADYCGDGVISHGEACDYGEANSNNGYCTEGCALNVCGDGLLFVGVELCDDGPGNSDVYGSGCGSQCTPAPRCGDGLLQVEEEECDLGPGNGTEEIDEEGTKCTSLCRLVAYRGFVTSTAYTGNLGGLDGADARCRLAAYAAALENAGTFRAFLSGDDVSANERFADRIGDPTPYYQAGGQMFAKSYDDLVANGPGDLGIFTDEFGVTIDWAFVATNTGPGGVVADAETSCLSWQSDSKDYYASVGLNAVAMDDPIWPSWKDMDWWVNQALWTCDSDSFHLYCLE